MGNLKNKVIGEIKRGFIFFSVIYAATTVFSSFLQLYQGQLTDTNIHILNRAAVVLITVITISLFDRIKLKRKVLSYIVPYVISMGIVFLYVWLSGFIEPLHRNAYRDIFLNFTAVAACVMIVLTIKDKWSKRSSSKQNKHNY
jgi:hypothetical protein